MDMQNLNNGEGHQVQISAPGRKESAKPGGRPGGMLTLEIG